MAMQTVAEECHDSLKVQRREAQRNVDSARSPRERTYYAAQVARLTRELAELAAVVKQERRLAS